MNKKKLAVICTHPIQYYAPLFRLLAGSGKTDIHVFYTLGPPPAGGRIDKDFGQAISWDIPLLQGYSYTFLANHSTDPGSHHFKGADNPDIIEQISQFKPDAILVYGWAYKSHFRVMRHFKGKIPVLFRGDSTLLDEKPGLKTLLRRLFLTWAYRYIDIAFYAGTENRKYFEKHGLRPSQLIFLPHAVDNARFAEPPEDKLSRRDIGLDDSVSVVLFAGKLLPKKAPGLLLDAFLAINHPATHLVITGNGILENELKAKAGNSDKVHFLDFRNQSEMPAIYRLADLFCLPSEGPGETWGLAVNEAMASGRAVLVSDKAGCSADLVEPGVNGETFKAGDIADLTKKLEFLLSDRTRLQQMGKAGADIIGAWSLDSQKEQIIDTLFRL